MAINFRKMESSTGQFKDGKVVRSPKGAVGAAQIMPATGPEAARLAGVDWDPVKFEQDEQYNIKLGRAYEAYLNNRFGGDQRLVHAAYNGGPTRLAKNLKITGGDVDAAIALMPKETRDYVAKASGGSSNGGGSINFGGGVNVKPTPGSGFLGDIETAIGTARDPTPVINPFEATTQINSSLKNVGEVLNKEGDWLDKVVEAQTVAQEERRKRLEKSIEARKAVNDTVMAETQSLLERTQPIVARRAEMASQLEKLATMNPLERGIRGIFDLNYNQEYLEDRVGELDNVLKTVGSDYQYITTLREKLISTIGKEDELSEQKETLGLLDLEEQGKTIALSLNHAQRQFAYVGDQVNANDTLVRSQITAIDTYLDQRSPAEMSKLLGEAIKNGGTVVADGIPLSVGELRTRVMASEQQELSFRASQMAFQSNELQLADQYATQWARYATQTQLEAAAANGGEYNGMKIPQDVLTAQLADRQQRANLRAEQVLRGDPMGQLSSQLSATSDELRIIGRRASTLFGGKLPPELKRMGDTLMAEANRIKPMLEAAERAGSKPEVVQALQAHWAKLQDAMRQQVDSLSLRYSGGDKVGANFIATYMRGEVMSPNASSEAMLHFVNRGGLPPGMRASSMAKQSFTAAKSASDAVDAETQGKGFTVAQVRALKIQRIMDATSKTYTRDSFNEVMSALPEIAVKLKSPFANVSRQDYETARRASDTLPWMELGRELGMSPANAEALFNGTYRGADRAEKIKAITPEKRGQIIARQQAVFIDSLDNSASAKEGFKPSRALADLVNSPEFTRVINSYQTLTKETSFGDFLAGQTSEGALQYQVGRWAKATSDAIYDQEIAQAAGTRHRKSYYATHPLYRARVAMSAITSLDESERALLHNAIKDQLKITDDSTVSHVSHKTIDGIIKGSKFQNPNLERIRQIAAKEWDEAQRRTDAMVLAYDGDE